jgi:transposase
VAGWSQVLDRWEKPGAFAVSDSLDLHQSTVSRVLRRFHETGEYSRRPGQGLRRTTTAQRDRFLLLQSLRHRTLTAPALQVMTLGRYQQ